MTKAKKSKKGAKSTSSRAPKAPPMASQVKTRAPKRTDKELCIVLVKHLQGFDDDHPQSAESVYQATRIDWYTVRRLFQENPRIFQATTETRRARYSLTAAGRKATTS